MKKVLLIFYIVSNVSSYISAAENPINAHITWDDLMKILETENQQFQQKCKQMLEQHQVLCNQIEEKHRTDLDTIQHVVRAPGSALNPDRKYLFSEPSKLTENAANKVMNSNDTLITTIEKEIEKNTQNNLTLIQQWITLQSMKKSQDKS